MPEVLQVFVNMMAPSFISTSTVKAGNSVVSHWFYKWSLKQREWTREGETEIEGERLIRIQCININTFTLLTIMCIFVLVSVYLDQENFYLQISVYGYFNSPVRACFVINGKNYLQTKLPTESQY